MTLAITPKSLNAAGLLAVLLLAGCVQTVPVAAPPPVAAPAVPSVPRVTPPPVPVNPPVPVPAAPPAPTGPVDNRSGLHQASVIAITGVRRT